ncbi:hypothetical protein [Micromonospora sp. NPDC049497]|uniref:hypothetical protein n=1 Tax=Micromonospora sp. NPDC049497 TaxID=3364273 RepID=UPI0037AA97A2
MPRLIVRTAAVVLLLSACGTTTTVPEPGTGGPSATGSAAPAGVAASPPVKLDGTEFDAGGLSGWRWLHEVEGGRNDLLAHDVGRTETGALHVEPKVSAWFERLRAPYLFQEREGDVLMVARVRAAGRNAEVPGKPYSLAGLMLRVPGADVDDWVFITTGTGVGGRPQLEVKTTRKGQSRLRLLGGAPGWVDLALARVGGAVVSLYRLPGGQWRVGARYDRTDLPARLQWGINAYTSWTSAAPSPDLKADVDYVRFYRPGIPSEWIHSATGYRPDEDLVRHLVPADLAD